VRLHDIEQAYGERVRVHWRAFPLIPDRQPGRRCTARTRESRQRAFAEEPRAVFVPPDLDSELPASSLPALTAAKCAERQGRALFHAFHRRLFVAHFQEHADIGSHDVLSGLAADCGLDVERFRHDYAAGEAYQAALRDCAEGAAWFGVSALPTVVFNEKLSLVGAVPGAQYRALLDWILAGEPGGVIPLALTPPQAATAGQSAVARPDPAR